MDEEKKKRRQSVPRTPGQPFTKDELSADAKRRASYIFKEFRAAFEFIGKYRKTVSIFGSARLSEDSTHYEKARQLAAKLSKLGYTIVTGGGPGIMEGANRGAFETGGGSVGLNIKLAEFQEPNRFTTDNMEFYSFFTRKVALSFAAEAYLFFPGGFGTLDEFFEIVTLIQTKKIRRVPVILVGSDYWRPLYNFLRNDLKDGHRTITDADLDLIKMCDNDEEIIKIILESPTNHGNGNHAV